MSTPGILPIPSSKSAPDPPVISKPVSILDNDIARLVSNTHPVLLLSIPLLSFPRVVEDPISALIGLASTTAVIQLLYCLVCLPSTGQAPPPPLKPGQKRKSVKLAQDLGARLVPALLSLLLSLFLSTPLLYITLILFGGPLTTHLPHTALLALHLALLITPQLYYVHGLDALTWRRIVSLQLPVDEVVGMSMGACVGAWLGAIPIPLDWDREWQKWPVTVVSGAYVGAVVGKLVGGHLVKGWKIKMS
nr:hypothetical protein B0A51_15764 [Rachicladosporium sp. CCFEE 5018]